MNDDQELLASAYLDGNVSDEERARVEADTELMAAVARLAEARRVLATVEPPDPARRDAAIEAALAAFDAERSDAERAGAAPPPVTSLTARRWSRWLAPAAAAAVVAIVAAGIVATTQDGDDDGGAAEAPVAGDVDQSAAEGAGTMAGDTTVMSRSAEDAAAPATTDVTGASTLAAGTEAPGTFAGGANEAQTGTTAVAEELARLTTRRELTDFAATNEFALPSAPSADRQPLCDEGVWQGDAIYVVDGVDTLVEIFVDEASAEVRAVDPDTCVIVARAPAP